SRRARHPAAGRDLLRRRRLSRRRLPGQPGAERPLKRGHMRTRSLALLLTTVSTSLAVGQSKLPPDINATSFSRLPPLDRAALDDEGKRIWDHIGGARGMPASGPAPASMYSPKGAEPIHELNEY